MADAKSNFFKALTVFQNVDKGQPVPKTTSELIDVKFVEPESLRKAQNLFQRAETLAIRKQSRAGLHDSPTDAKDRVGIFMETLVLEEDKLNEAARCIVRDEAAQAGKDDEAFYKAKWEEAVAQFTEQERVRAAVEKKAKELENNRLTSVKDESRELAFQLQEIEMELEKVARKPEEEKGEEHTQGRITVEEWQYLILKQQELNHSLELLCGLKQRAEEKRKAMVGALSAISNKIDGKVRTLPQARTKPSKANPPASPRISSQVPSDSERNVEMESRVIKIHQQISDVTFEGIDLTRPPSTRSLIREHTFQVAVMSTVTNKTNSNVQPRFVSVRRHFILFSDVLMVCCVTKKGSNDVGYNLDKIFPLSKMMVWDLADMKDGSLVNAFEVLRTDKKQSCCVVANSNDEKSSWLALMDRSIRTEMA